MIKISVIVPVYNVEKYLKKCLDSLVKQTLKDIEIIIVNDGTKDNSQKIIDSYSKKYPKLIKAYKKENGGLSSARNYGIEKASGEYLAFVDSDDYVDISMYEDMYIKAKSKDFDLVVCNLEYIYPKKSVKANSNIKEDLFTKEEIKKSMLDIYPAAWNKLFHKRLFEHNIRFKEKVWFEDVEFIYRLYPYIESIGVCDGYYYKYVQRDGAITSTFDERLFHYIENWNGIIDFYKKNNFYNEYKKELEYCYVRYLYATFVKRATNFEKDKYKEAVNEAILNVKKRFPKYRSNSYFYRNPKGMYLLLFGKMIGNIYYKISHKRTKIKVMFISSTGGHFNELSQLSSIYDNYDYRVVTEKTKSTAGLKKKYGNRVKFLVFGTKDHIFSYPFKFGYNCIKSLFLFLAFRPKVIVTTGTHTAVPMCYIGKLFRSKVIFIETFANSKTKTLAGRMIYPIADEFIVQWESMLELYPKAKCFGWIY